MQQSLKHDQSQLARGQAPHPPAFSKLPFYYYRSTVYTGLWHTREYLILDAKLLPFLLLPFCSRHFDIFQGTDTRVLLGFLASVAWSRLCHLDVHMLQAHTDAISLLIMSDALVWCKLCVLWQFSRPIAYLQACDVYRSCSIPLLTLKSHYPR